MELNIPNPDSKDFCAAVGIAPERQQELSKALDAMVARLNSGPMKLVQSSMTGKKDGKIVIGSVVRAMEIQATRWLTSPLNCC